MDNICHTLVGAACGEAGLKRVTRFGSATLMVAANLPDVDVLVFATDVPSVAFRRGWTHGVLAQVLLPILLAAVVYAAGRKRGARFRPLLLLSCIGVLSHVALDLLNNYGVRLLMPFSGRWFYGDAVFIVDPWLWLMLGAGVWFARRGAGARAALVAVCAATVYIALMVGSARVARAGVAEAWRSTHGRDPRALMVGPVPVTPFRRVVIVDAGDAYATGTCSWLGRMVTYDPATVPKGDDHPAVRLARADHRIAAVLTWARFPYYEVTPREGGVVVTLRDLRFGARVGAVEVFVAGSWRPGVDVSASAPAAPAASPGS